MGCGGSTQRSATPVEAFHAVGAEGSQVIDVDAMLHGRYSPPTADDSLSKMSSALGIDQLSFFSVYSSSGSTTSTEGVQTAVEEEAECEALQDLPSAEQQLLRMERLAAAGSVLKTIRTRRCSLNGKPSYNHGISGVSWSRRTSLAVA